MVRTYSEVFKLIGKREVRGRVTCVNEDSFDVLYTDKDGSTSKESVKLSELGINVFESEKDLIREKGTELIELAPPRIVELKYANDFYGLHICEGDSVIAMANQPLYNKVSGKIAKVYMLSSIGFENMTFIDVVNDDGEIICERALANQFTVPQRFMG